MAEKKLMLGNQAIARGAYEAGVKVSSAYPGTPSTEISENLVQYKDVLYSEWAPNEAVAAEVAIGASISGVRAMCCMKHVGLNVAADALYSIDEKSTIRKSHQNPAVIEIYKEYLKKPGSEKSHKYLHTHYTKREKYNLAEECLKV